jgi:hypothetical protein
MQIVANYVLPRRYGGQERKALFFDNGTCSFYSTDVPNNSSATAEHRLDAVRFDGIIRLLLTQKLGPAEAGRNDEAGIDEVLSIIENFVLHPYDRFFDVV